MKKRDKYLICSILAMVSLFLASFYLSINENALPDAVIYGWCAFWGNEVWQLARIKINESKKKENNHEQ